MGGPDYHNLPLHHAELAGIFAGEGHVDLRITADLETLNPGTLARYQAVINWSTFVQPTPWQVDALLAAIDGGMGFFAMHGGSATFWNNAPYLTMLGSRFLRHDPYKEFLVEIAAEPHPITEGVDNFWVNDELYELGGKTDEFAAFSSAITEGNPYGEDVAALGEGELAPDIQVLASAEGHPLLYTRTWGQGRVHYNALGHDLQALSHPAFRRLALQGLAWVTSPE